MHRRSFLTAAGAGLALAGHAFADAAKPPVKLAKAYPFLEAYLKLPAAQRSRFHPAYYLMQDGHPAGGYRAQIIDGAARIDVPVEADGRLGRLPTLAQLQGPAQFQLLAPSALKFGLKLEVQASMPAQNQLDAHELSLAIQQAADAVKVIAGAMAFAAPKLAAAAFPGAGAGQATLADGRSLPLVASRLGPMFEPARAPGARLVSLTRPPSRIVLAPAA
ncbi:MAG TPA: hypothetical protein VG939_17000 [Caulobacteraceae bacterium]|nr:hypothetical protein [Caulobacteraceae bacterium]